MVNREELLGRTLVELADTLVDDFDVVDLLSLVVDRSVQLLDASAAGLVLGDAQGMLHVMATTSEATHVVELFQVQNDEGPCRDCFRTGVPVLVPDLLAEDRWPGFVSVAVGAGFRAAHALPLRLRSDALGALNLFRAEPGPLAEADVTAAQALADVATIAILQHQAASEAQRLNDQLRVALNSRVAIEQAKGIIAERAGLDMAEAFARLRTYARSNRRPLADVAQEVVDGTISSSALVG